MVLLNPYLFILLQSVLVSLIGKVTTETKKEHHWYLWVIKIKGGLWLCSDKMYKSKQQKIMMMVPSQLTDVFYAVKKGTRWVSDMVRRKRIWITSKATFWFNLLEAVN